MRITIKPFILRGFNLSPDIFHVSLRVYALNSFVAQSDDRIVQPGAPSESPFYEEWPCTRLDGELHLPQIEIESTIDALSPAHPESLRYYAAFFDRDNYICPYWPKPVFALDAYPNPTTWAHIIAYNSPGVEFDWTTEHADHFSKEEFDYLLQNPPAIVIGGITVLPPLQFDGTTLWIPKASAVQDGYISKEDFAAFAAGGTGVGTVTSITAGTGLSGGTITDSGTLAVADIPGVEGTYFAPHITVNAQGQITDIHSTTGGDSTPPNISNVHYGSLGPTTITVMWDTDDPADSLVDYGITTGYGSSMSDPTLVMSGHSLTLTGLTPSQNYHFRVTSVGPSGTAIGTDVPFTTPAVPDTFLPVLSAETATAIGLTSVTITWTTDEAANSQVNYGLGLGYGTLTPITETSGVTLHSVTISGLTSGVTYHYQCKSRDMSPAQNLGISALDHSFTTLAPDTTPPTISGEVVSGIGSDQAVIGWTTSEAADSQVGYGLSIGSYGTLFPVTPAVIVPPGTSHAVHLTGLAPSTTYHYQCRSRDAAGNLGVSTLDHSFTTSAVGVDLMSGLMSFWKMEEASGTRFDTHGPNHFTVAVAITTDPGGRIGNCVAGIGGEDISVTSSYLDCPYDSNQDMPGDFTIAGWMLINTVEYLNELPCLLACWLTAGGLRSFIVLYNFLGGHYQFSISSDGVNQADLYFPSEGGAPAPAGGWTFYCARYTAATATMSLRINNSTPVTAAAVELGTGTPLPAGPIFPAMTGITSFMFDTYKRTNAKIDELGIWKRYLADAEVDLLASGTVTYPF